jgi:ABC-type multidrug transport system fused ATPase/permease subunit
MGNYATAIVEDNIALAHRTINDLIRLGLEKQREKIKARAKRAFILREARIAGRTVL